MPSINFKKTAKILFWVLVFVMAAISVSGFFVMNRSDKTTAQTAVNGQGTPGHVAKWVNCPTCVPSVPTGLGASCP